MSGCETATQAWLAFWTQNPPGKQKKKSLIFKNWRQWSTKRWLDYWGRKKGNFLSANCVKTRKNTVCKPKSLNMFKTRMYFLLLIIKSWTKRDGACEAMREGEKKLHRKKTATFLSVTVATAPKRSLWIRTSRRGRGTGFCQLHFRTSGCACTALRQLRSCVVAATEKHKQGLRRRAGSALVLLISHKF